MPDKIPVGKLLENVIDEMLEGVQIVDHKWRYLYVNNTVVNQAKTTNEALIGKTMMESFPGIDKTPLFKQLEKAKKKQVSIRMKNEFEYPDGSKGWFELYIQPVEVGILILSLNITDRKRLEDELKKKVEDLENFTDAFVHREMRMLELKEKINILKKYMPTDTESEEIG